MADIWQYKHDFCTVCLKTKGGRAYTGKVICVADADEAGTAEDCLVLDVQGGICEFLPSEIESIEKISG